ncbi:hypothetical protein N7528_007358 [Penicillium herquei]|nr:hypothetical protein N7528_007358 [Penicillium herquei]
METDDGDEESAEEPPTPVHRAATQRKRKTSKKGKKGKQGKKMKTKGAKMQFTSGLEVRTVPLESYGIIEDESGKTAIYYMAIHSIMHQWMVLRHHLQSIWQAVAYKDLNTAAASSLCNVAIEMIKDSQSQIFIDFPGRESFHDIIEIITSGDPEQAQTIFDISISRLGADGAIETFPESNIDMKEGLLIHTFQHLWDFVIDYRKNRSGKPTKAMLKSIKNWDPHCDFSSMSKEERLQWRRSFTINWLYDLVNLFVWYVMTSSTMDEKDIHPKTVQWSKNGSSDDYRRLLGVHDFASDIALLAIQKPGAEVRSKILPHHVFQLQCIVDSLTVFRGWSISVLNGHVLTSPAKGFEPQRDLDVFMDRAGERPMKGFCSSVRLLTDVLDKDSTLYGDPLRHEEVKAVLDLFHRCLVTRLGETRFIRMLPNIPPSRFSDATINGVWEYSPFLCGAGLSEALSMTYGLGMHIWDYLYEPLCVIHIHNMLVTKGLLTKPVDLWDVLEKLFADDCFAKGQRPDGNFLAAFEAVLWRQRSRREQFQTRAERIQLCRTATNLNDLLDPRANRFFKTRSLLQVFSHAGWNSRRIPDEDMNLTPGLTFIRLTETKQRRDPVTGKVALVNTSLVRHLKSLGFKDGDLVKFSKSTPSKGSSIAKELMEHVQSNLPDEYTVENPADSQTDGTMDHSRYLAILRDDLIDDICGHIKPLSSLNYISVLAHCFLLFEKIEQHLRACRNPSWIQAYEQEHNDKHIALTRLALMGRDNECLRIMASAFENQRRNFIDHVYWDDLTDTSTMMEPLRPDDGTPFSPKSFTVIQAKV